MKLSKSLSSLYSIPKLASPVKFFRKTAGANKFISAMLFSAFFLANSIIKAQTAPELGEAERFAVLAGDSITSTDSAFVKGDVGATTLIDSTIISDGGTFKDTACIVVSAINDLTIAKQEAAAQPATAVAPQTLKDTTLTSGVYQISQLRIKDTLILSGDSTSVFIFNISDSLIFEAGSVIILDGVKSENVFWNVTGSVCLEDSASVCGTVMADGTICCHQEAQVISGRLLSSQSVTLEQAGTVDSRKAQQFTIADIDLGAAAYFAVLAGENITVANPISAVGNVGATGAISGAITASDTLFPANDCRVQQAISDLGNVINTIINLPAALISEQLGGQALAPGVYYVNADAILNGTLTLTGDSASVYVFRFLGSDLASHELTVTNNSILDIGDVRLENIYWAGSNITLGENINFSGIVISFKGEIIAQGKNTGKASLMAMQSITLFNINQNNPVYLYSQFRMRQPPPLFTVEDIDMGATASFAVLAGVDIIANDPISAIGNVGAVGSVSGNISASDTLFPSNDPKVQQAIADLGNAINIIENIPVDSAISGILGGQTLAEGVYEIAGNVLLSGTLTLTGDTSSIYVFKIVDSLTVDTSAVLELGNVLPQNVYWAGGAGSLISIGENVNFSGIVITKDNIISESNNAGKLSLLSVGKNITLFNDNPSNPIYLISRTNLTISFVNPCGFDEVLETILQEDTFLQEVIDNQLQKIKDFIDTNTSPFKESPCTQFYTIPVVVHVVYDPSILSGDISVAQIISQIDKLNFEFANAAGTSFPAEDMCVKFCLAEKLPNGTTDWTPFTNSINGHPPTSGITRTPNGIAAYDQRPSSPPIPNTIGFPLDEYLNIWVVEDISGALGYSYWPLAGITSADGIVIRNEVFGDNENCPSCYSLLSNNDQGKVLVHETGHYLGLLHTFGFFNTPGCPFSNYPNCIPPLAQPEDYYDKICDTPPVDDPNFSCIPSTSCGSPDMIENYMDYTPDACKTTFTLGQWEFIEATINIISARANLTNIFNLIATGVAAIGGCVDIGLTSEFTVDNTQPCSGTDPVTFTGVPTTYDQWTFSFSGPGTLADVTNTTSPSQPIATVNFPTGGAWTVTLTVFDAGFTPSISTTTKTQIVYVTDCNPIISSQGWWHFGTQVVIDFSSGIAVPTTPTASFFRYGVATMSDLSTGDLLFYCNTQDVFDRNHNSMTGAYPLAGGQAIQGVLIVPHPGNVNQYYIFVAGGSPQVLSYRIVDMSLINSFGVLGDLISTQNVLVAGTQTITDHLTAIPHCNGIDYWIIVHSSEAGSEDKLLSYLLTASGLITTPVMNNSFSVPVGSALNGNIEVSKDGRRVAISRSNGTCHIYNFDKQTGTFDFLSQTTTREGIAFSPSGNFLYTNHFSVIRQYDLRNLSACNTNIPYTNIFYLPLIQFSSAMQLGPDDKIYMNTGNLGNQRGNALSVINFPENLNTNSNPNACGLNIDAIPLLPGQVAEIAFPNMIDAIPATPPVDFEFCITGCGEVHFKNLGCGNTFLWDFGDGNTSALQNPVHTYTITGNYTVNFSIDGIPAPSQVVNVTILTVSITNVDQDCVGSCNGNATVIPNGTPPYTYSWSNGQTTATASGLCAGTYTVTITDANGCTVFASAAVSEPPTLTISSEVATDITCNGLTNGSITITASGGTGALVYSINGGATFSSAGSFTGLSAGTYNVIVKDANLCTATGSTLIINNPSPITISKVVSTNVSCNGETDGTMTIIASGGTGTLDYSIDGGITFFTNSGNFTVGAGTYNVAVKDANGCTAFGSTITIKEPPFPQSNFTTSVTEICTGDLLSFTNTSVTHPSFTYLWNFGDGITSTQQNPPPHTYTAPGTFQINLIVTDLCGQSHNSSQIINVIPCFPGYNDGGCSNTITYTYNDYYVTCNEVWNPAPPFSPCLPITICPANTFIVIKIRGTLRIYPGVSLTIEGTTLEFGPNGKVIVERGGLLHLKPGNNPCQCIVPLPFLCLVPIIPARLTGLSSCGTMWQGVEVWGDANLPQTPANQGKIIIESSTIEMAHNAVLLGRTCGPPLCDAPMFLPGYGGGIIETHNPIPVYGNQFLQNAVSIKFTPYNSSISGVNNVSDIDSCNFSGGILPDPGYTIGNVYTYPNNANPFYPIATVDGTPPYHVFNWSIRGVPFSNNEFKNAVTAIQGYDAENLAITFNTIEDCDRGITLLHPSVTSTTHLVQNNNISNILPFGGWNIRLDNGALDDIVSNTLSGIPSQFNYGIVMLNSGEYSVSENTSTDNQFGIINVNSGTYGKVCKNTVDFTDISMLIAGNNNNLEVVCNTMSNYNRAWWVLGTLSDQGAANNPASNLFNDATIDICSGTGFDYHYNASPPEAFPNNNTGIIGFIQCSGPDPVNEVLETPDASSHCLSVTCTEFTLAEILANYDNATTCEEKAKWGKELIEYYIENDQEQDAIAFLQSFVSQNVNIPTCDGNNIRVCHVPPGNSTNEHTICVNPNALQSHLNHGDYIGTCAQDCFDSIMVTEAIFMIVPELLQDSLFADALNMLAQLPLINNEQIVFVQYYQLLIDLFSQNKNYFDIDTIQTQTLLDIANSCTRTATRAQALLQLVFNMDFPLFWDQCIDTLSKKKMGGSNSGGKEVQDKPITSDTLTPFSSQILEQNIAIFPNPNIGKFRLIIVSANKEIPSSVLVYNKMGKIIYRKDELQNHYLDFDLSKDAKGMYFIEIIKGEELFVKKVILE